MRAICLLTPHHRSFNDVSLLGENYKLWMSSLCNFLRSLLDPDTSLCTLFPNFLSAWWSWYSIVKYQGNIDALGCWCNDPLLPSCLCSFTWTVVRMIVWQALEPTPTVGWSPDGSCPSPHPAETCAWGRDVVTPSLLSISQTYGWTACWNVVDNSSILRWAGHIARIGEVLNS